MKNLFLTLMAVTCLFPNSVFARELNEADFQKIEKAYSSAMEEFDSNYDTLFTEAWDKLKVATSDLGRVKIMNTLANRLAQLSFEIFTLIDSIPQEYFDEYGRGLKFSVRQKISDTQYDIKKINQDMFKLGVIFIPAEFSASGKDKFLLNAPDIHGFREGVTVDFSLLAAEIPYALCGHLKSVAKALSAPLGMACDLAAMGIDLAFLPLGLIAIGVEKSALALSRKSLVVIASPEFERYRLN